MPGVLFKGASNVIELNTSRVEQVIMLGGLALFLTLATVIPA